MGLFPSLGCAAAIMSLLLNYGLMGWSPPPVMLSIGGGISVFFLFLWLTIFTRMLVNRFHRKQLKKIDDLVMLDNQSRRDSWTAVKDLAIKYLEKTEGKLSLWRLEEDLSAVKKILEQGTKEIRETINEIAAIPPGEKVDNPSGPFLSALARQIREADVLKR
jgi:hypothetical protein